MIWPPALVPGDRCISCKQLLRSAITPKEFDEDETPHDYAVVGGHPGEEGYLCALCWRRRGARCKVEGGKGPFGIIITKVAPRLGGLGIAFTVHGQGVIAAKFTFTPTLFTQSVEGAPVPVACSLVFTSGGYLSGNEVHGLSAAGNPYKVTWVPRTDGVDCSKVMITPSAGRCSC